MYIHPEKNQDQCNCKSKNLAKLQQFLRDATAITKKLYDDRLKAILVDTKTNERIRKCPKKWEKRQLVIRVRRMGACCTFELPQACKACRGPSCEDGGGSDKVHCVFWKGEYFISGLDISKIMIWRVENKDPSIFSTDNKNAADTSNIIKTIKEGVNTDLRYLSTEDGHCVLEEAKSDFLVWLCKHECVRTQKRQKIYKWLFVDFDALFEGCLERIQKLREVFTKGYSNTTENNGNISIKQGCPSLSPSTIFIGENDPFFGVNVEDYNSQAFAYNDDGAAWLIEGDGRNIENRDHDCYDNLVDMLADHSALYNGGSGMDFIADDSKDQRTQVKRTPLSGTPLSESRRPRRLIPATIADKCSHQDPHQPEFSAEFMRKSKHDQNRKFACTFPNCQKRFKRLEHMKRHMRIHTGERPYVCKVAGCDRAFGRADNLKMHLKTHPVELVEAANFSNIMDAKQRGNNKNDLFELEMWAPSTQPNEESIEAMFGI